jgi:hypothetical protein
MIMKKIGILVLLIFTISFISGCSISQPFDNNIETGIIKEIDYSISLLNEETNYNSKDIAFLNKQWSERIDNAFASSDCKKLTVEEFPPNYYQGPLIDTHLHIPALPDDEFRDYDEEDKDDNLKGVDAELYDAIPKDEVPSLGRSVKIKDIVCTLNQEGTIKAFAFFPVYPDTPVPLIEVAHRSEQQYPSLFVPFIQSTGSKISTVESDILQKMLTIRPNLFRGLGEIGDSPTEPINLPPDAPIYIGDFQVAKDHDLIVYFHPGYGHQENLERALEQFPEVTFVVHADNIAPYIDTIMDKHPNVYYTFNDIFEDHIPLFRFGEKQMFIDAMERDWNKTLDKALIQYKDVIEKHPDRFMWGTDRSDIAWNYDADVGLLLTRYGRAFIGQLDPTVQEKVAYKNAEVLITKSGLNG